MTMEFTTGSLVAERRYEQSRGFSAHLAFCRRCRAHDDFQDFLTDTGILLQIQQNESNVTYACMPHYLSQICLIPLRHATLCAARIFQGD